MIDRRSAMAGGLSLFAAGTVSSARGQTNSHATREDALSPGPDGSDDGPDAIVDLWPAGTMASPRNIVRETVVERSSDTAVRDRAIAGIVRPRLALFQPRTVAHTGAAAVIAPGGGYRHVVVDREGFEMARWLADRGIAAFVLFYRLPGDGWADGADVALIDAQRAIRIVRHRHAEFGIDPDHVAMIGFSAGGHLCADLAARFAQPLYGAVDAADNLSARPFCAAPIYPVVTLSGPDAHAGARQRLLGSTSTEHDEQRHSPHRTVAGDAPPHFIVHAEDDSAVPVANALLLRSALVDAGVSVDTHVFAKGGHGFGLRRTAGLPVAIWPELWLAWARGIGLA